jgi:glycosyltransferase involved in cell wall biosynthesis
MPWKTYSMGDIIKNHSLSMFKVRWNHNKYLAKEKKKLQALIRNNKYDYIIATQYELLDLLPKEYLSHVLYEQHTSFKECWAHRDSKKTLIKYNNLVNYIWLSKATMNDAVNEGLNNCHYIYNPLRFTSKKKSNVNNKRIVTIARLSKQKRLDRMIDYVEEIFKDKKYKDWVLEIYGDGSEEEYLKSLVHNKKQIKFMGRTDTPEEILIKSDINLNTSDYEGFPMCILEACECGVPTVTLNFGESVYETIIDKQTGFVCETKEDFINRLKELMDDNNLLKDFSEYNISFATNFNSNKVVKKWIKVFNEIDNK